MAADSKEISVIGHTRVRCYIFFVVLGNLCNCLENSRTWRVQRCTLWSRTRTRFACFLRSNFLLLELFSALLNIYHVVTGLRHRFTLDPAALLLLLFLMENVAQDSDFVMVGPISLAE